MRLLVGVIGLLALAAAAALAGLMLAARVSGLSPAQPVGNLWFALDSGSLNATQAAVERYLWPPLWDYGVFPVLQVQAPLAAAASFVLALVLLFALRRRRTGPGRRRRIFK